MKPYRQPPVWDQAPDIDDFEKPGMFETWGDAVHYLAVLALAVAIIAGFVWAVGVL